MTSMERKLEMAVLRERLEGHDAAAITHMRDARKHLRCANQIKERLDELSLSTRQARERAAT